jgi:hypothetical protein
MPERTVSVRFGSEIANLHDLGYIATDLHQIVAFADLLAEGHVSEVQKYFGEDARPFNRYLGIIGRYREHSEIVDAHKGSVELVLSGLSLLASLVMPLVAIEVRRRVEQAGKSVSFEVSPDDPVLRRVLDAHANGDFGSGQPGLETLFAVLKSRGYRVEIRGEDLYAIEHVVDRYAQRIVRTVQKYL